jgi:hypothetical protein
MWGHGGSFRRFQGDKQPNKKKRLGKKHLQSSKLPDFEEGKKKNLHN